MPRSRIILFLLIVLAACGHEQPKPGGSPVADLVHGGRRVLFIGLDGVDWRLVDRLIADGTMPHMGSLSREGDRRTLLTQNPPLSPLVWTTMMTGVSPLEHRILDFTRYDPRTRERQPITSDERAVPAIWNMATYGGKSVGVFGMWATDPPESVNGTIVSKSNITSRADDAAARVQEETEATRLAAVRWIAFNDPDLAIVYFQGTDEIAHLTRGNVNAARAYFRRIDEILGELQALAQKKNADVVIASDHGFDWGGSHESSTSTATAAKWHRAEGMFLHWPARGKQGGGGAHVDQIAATLLSLLGLPHDDRLAQPIDGFERSRERVDYRRYFRVKVQPAPDRDDMRDREAIARLKALGYIGSGETMKGPSSANSTRTPASFNNEGLILAERGRMKEAESTFLAALAIDPAYESAKSNLADLLIARARKAGGPAAIELLSRVIALRDNDDVRIFRGRYRLEQHDCRGALTDFESIRIATAASFVSVAAAEGCLGNSVAAEKALRRSLDLDPNQPRIREMLPR